MRRALIRPRPCAAIDAVEIPRLMADPAFDRIVHVHGESLARVAWGYVDSAADHDDLMQDILLAVWLALPRFRNKSSERTFVFRIAHNRGCTFLARRRDHAPLRPDAPIADPRPGPDEDFDEARRRERLAAAVRTLPEAQRQAVLLRLEGLAIGEIAALQGTSDANVSVRLTRARDRLRNLLRGEDQ
jgi:RNA polymerase sigma factor (sigma-70 family)